MQDNTLTRTQRTLIVFRLGTQEHSNQELSVLLENVAEKLLELSDVVNRLTDNPSVQRAGVAPSPVTTAELALLMSTIALTMNRLESQAHART